MTIEELGEECFCAKRVCGIICGNERGSSYRDLGCDAAARSGAVSVVSELGDAVCFMLRTQIDSTAMLLVTL